MCIGAISLTVFRFYSHHHRHAFYAPPLCEWCVDHIESSNRDIHTVNQHAVLFTSRHLHFTAPYKTSLLLFSNGNLFPISPQIIRFLKSCETFIPVSTRLYHGSSKQNLSRVRKIWTQYFHKHRRRLYLTWFPPGSRVTRILLLISWVYPFLNVNQSLTTVI